MSSLCAVQVSPQDLVADVLARASPQFLAELRHVSIALTTTTLNTTTQLNTTLNTTTTLNTALTTTRTLNTTLTTTTLTSCLTRTVDPRIRRVLPGWFQN